MSVERNGNEFTNETGSIIVDGETGGWFFEHTDDIRCYVALSGSKNHPQARLGIYGTPEGLMQLADFLTAIARVDQTIIPDRHCPAKEGMHTHIHLGSFEVTIGRLDAKSDPKNTRWLKGQDVCYWE